MAASTTPGASFNVESFINEYYGAWSGTDEDLIMSHYSKNVVLQIPGTLMEGREPSASSSFGHLSLHSRETATL